MLMGMRRKGVSKRELREHLKRHVSQLAKSVPMENRPIIHLSLEVVSASAFVWFVKNLARRRLTFKVEAAKVTGKITRGVFRKVEKSFKVNLKPLLEDDLAVQLLPKYPHLIELERSGMKDLLLPYAFIKIWTALEYYLEMRVKLGVLRTDDSLLQFARRIQDDLPDNWKGIKKKDKVIDYALNIREIVSDYLTFPYHDFKEGGKVQIVYKQCYDIIITKFPEIVHVQKLAQKRHRLLHQGTNLFGIPTMRFSYKDILEMAELILSFGEWIEGQIQESNKPRKKTAPP
jgi:hypothetical protein